ncbi:hypothetical protein QTG54_011688 [Skeletonema marinoi]|uniref:Exonuclease 1 n=1 Tax=Skeletonema marinoi TaxID=267567 RepID=A0AAD8Y0Z1_9STRA|nr:hypothetical protein QTG54_011688 [Skeletonema marinoi]
MGISDLLPHLPGGKSYLQDFYELRMEQNAVPIDAAGLLWQCALMHSSEYLSGNLLPALIEWTQHLNYFRSICQWKMRLYLDGMNNPHKEFENERRRLRRDSAEHEHGRIRNTPEYLAQAAWIAKNVLKIPCYISKEEADPQVAYEAVSKGLVPVTGDSDLIAYGAVKVILVKSYSRGWYRVIDLEVDTEPGEYPLYDLYKDNGVIVFQLYAGCRGCDFTNEECGIKGIGFTAFMTIASAVEGDLNALTFSKAMWSSDNTKQIALDNQMESVEQVETYLQHIINIFSDATIYDEQSNTITMKGMTVEEATDVLEM